MSNSKMALQSADNMVKHMQARGFVERTNQIISHAVFSSGLFDPSLLNTPAHLLTDAELNQAINMANLLTMVKQ